MNLTKSDTRGKQSFWDKSSEQIWNETNPELLQKARQKIEKMNIKDKNSLKKSISWFFVPENMKKKTRESIQAKLKLIDILSIIFATVGLLSNIIACSLHLQFEVIHTISPIANQKLITINVFTIKSDAITSLRWLTTITTVLLMILIVHHYMTRLQFLIYQQRLEINSNLISSKLYIGMMVELLICIVHCPPYTEDIEVPISTTGVNSIIVNIDFDLILSSFIMSRVYLFIKFYSYYSYWADDKAQKICDECNVLGGLSFAIKAELKERPYFTIGLIMSISIIIFGYSLRNIEVAFVKDIPSIRFQDWRFVWNGFWCIIVTILTIGFGDYYPQTHLGRLISVIACLWGTFLISLMVVSMTSTVEFTPQEEKAYEELKNTNLKVSLRTKAIKLIRLGHKLKYCKEKILGFNDRNSRLEYAKASDEFRLQIDEFRILRMSVKVKEQEVSAESILNKLNLNVTDQMEQLIQLSNYNVTSLIDYLHLSKEIQNQISEYSSKLEILIGGLHKCIKA